jgi:hypothetical protein
MPRKPPQLNQLQPERLDSGDEAVQCGAVDHQTDQRGLGSRRARVEWVERPEHSGRQPPCDPEGVLSAHDALQFDGVSDDIIGEME